MAVSADSAGHLQVVNGHGLQSDGRRGSRC